MNNEADSVTRNNRLAKQSGVSLPPGHRVRDHIKSGKGYVKAKSWSFIGAKWLKLLGHNI